MARTFLTTADRALHVTAAKAARLLGHTTATRAVTLNQVKGLTGAGASTGHTYIKPAIATVSTIAHGATGATVVVTLVGDTFKTGIATSDITFAYDTTGLTISTTTRNTSTQITLVFTGTSDAGVLSITPKASAYDVGLYVPAAVTITVPVS